MNVRGDVQEKLLHEDPAYRRLVDKHQEYEDRLEALRARRYLSDEEQLEEVRIKKLKLALKDRMEAMVADTLAARG